MEQWTTDHLAYRLRYLKCRYGNYNFLPQKYLNSIPAPIGRPNRFCQAAAGLANTFERSALCEAEGLAVNLVRSVQIRDKQRIVDPLNPS